MVTAGAAWMYTKSILWPGGSDFNHLGNEYVLLASGLERPHKGPYNLWIEKPIAVNVWCGDLFVIDATYL